MRDDGQRHIRKRFQEPLCRRLVGHLLLVVWVQTGECGLLLLQRPPQHKLQIPPDLVVEFQPIDIIDVIL